MKFIKFAFIGLITTLVYTVMIWIYVEKLKYSSLIVTPILTLCFFISKYFLFDRWVFKE